MISQTSLALAIERGIVSADQAERLRALERELSAAEPVDDEKLRFITGFGDIFVTIGILLFVGALAYFAREAGGWMFASATTAAASWALAEFFTRRRRMALPSIVLLVTFSWGVFLLALLAGHTAIGAPDATASATPWSGVYEREPLIFAAAALATALAVTAHYWRFRVPITVAVGAAALVGTVMGLLGLLAPELTVRHFRAILLLAGLVVFALAMRFDMADPQRLSRKTDIAFWLHLLAAPLIVHPLIGGYILGRGAFDSGTALAILAIFLGLAVIAVLVDRRAILVSGLAYAGIAFGTLLRQTNFADRTIPTTLLVLGAFVLLLSAGWRPLRNAFLAMLPPAWARHLPHPGVPFSS